MKGKTVVCVFLAASLAAGGSAFGQGRDDRDDRGRDRHAERDWRHDQRADRGERREERRDERGAGPYHQFHRGDRLPREYRHRNYVVDDWREHHLSAPPRGYHWVQTGEDYVLVAIATGVILQLLLGH